MKAFRKLITHRKLAIFLAVGMLLRSVIAVGYMLDTSPVDGSLFTITICEGPAGINAIEGLDKEIPHHGNHQDHSEHGEKHDHASQEHQFSSCSFWSSSSLSLLQNLTLFDISDALFSDEAILYRNHFIHQPFNNSRFARAPPVLS